MRWIVLAFALVGSTSTHAFDDKYKFCALSGWFYGANNQFMGDLASTKVEYGDSTCLAVWKDARSIGEAFSKSGKLQDGPDNQLAQQALEFQVRVMESILKDAGY